MEYLSIKKIKDELVNRQWCYNQDLLKESLNLRCIKETLRCDVKSPYFHHDCCQYHCHNSLQYRTCNRGVVYDHFKNCRLKEHLWVSINHIDKIKITGNYTMEIRDNAMLYKPTPCLKLNDVPVLYIITQLKNRHNGYRLCVQLTFCFDLKTYCTIIDLVLKLKFPMDIKKYILTFM